MDPELLRTHNQRIVDAYVSFGAPASTPIMLMCECSSGSCNTMIEVTASEHREASADGELLVAVGHHESGVRVIRSTDRFLVVSATATAGAD